MNVVDASESAVLRIATKTQWQPISSDPTIADVTTIETSLSPNRSMRWCPDRMFDRHAIDSRLVAAVQINAGARCHEAANLLNCYRLASRAYALSVSCQNRDTAVEDLELIEQSERALRKFLFECRVRH